MNASFIKRLSAYAIDIILVGAIIMLIYYFIPETKTVTNLQRNVAILNENYLNKQINTGEYINDYSILMHNLDKERMILIFINFIAIFSYFVVLPFFTKGKTIGKYILGIKIKPSKEKLTIISLFIRNIIITGLGYLILSLLSLLLIPKNLYFYAITILGIIQLALVIISTFMIIYRKDRRGLQDILSKTTVVNK